MKVSVPVMIQDPAVNNEKFTENVTFDDNMFTCFLDGPVTDRVAVIDFHPKTGKLVKGAKFKAPKPGNVRGSYLVKDKQNIQADDLIQCSAFGTVAETMKMFEAPDTLGRKLVWSFDSPQILIVPRAGEWANAFYQRDTHSLQFFYFQSENEPDKTIYTCLSRDIVAHETGHAIFDGICPNLYDAITPQSLALHEAIADLTALFMAFRSRELCKIALQETNGSIAESTPFGQFAEEFGKERKLHGTGPLRNFQNEEILDHEKVCANPHQLCNILTGAIYNIAVKMHNKEKKKQAKKPGTSEFSVSGRALFIIRERLKRMLFRALDYLPPGEVTFADYGRAIIAADKAAHPKDSQERKWLKQEFQRRQIIKSEDELEVKTNYTYKPKGKFDLKELVSSEWTAYTFANKNREFLGIPNNSNVPFEIHPRLDVTKEYYVGKKDPIKSRECLFKVSWQHTEPNRLGKGFPSKRRFTVGTMVAIDWDETERLHKQGKNELAIRAVLSNAPTKESAKSRNKLLKRMLATGLLVYNDSPEGLDGIQSRNVAKAESADGHFRVRGTGQTLHMMVEL